MPTRVVHKDIYYMDNSSQTFSEAVYIEQQRQKGRVVLSSCTETHYDPSSPATNIKAVFTAHWIYVGKKLSRDEAFVKELQQSYLGRGTAIHIPSLKSPRIGG